VTDNYLATYLIDHLAGSAAAIELLEDLEGTYAGTALTTFFAELQADIAADQKELQGLMNRLQIGESRPRNFAAWLAEKSVALKVRLDDKANGPLRLIESLEVVGLGVHGKLALWEALKATAEEVPRLRGLVDYESLAQRAQEQRNRIEIVRLEAAKAAFARRSANIQ
jgi:hypothetical protein